MNKPRLRLIQPLLCACALWTAPVHAAVKIPLDDNSTSIVMAAPGVNPLAPGARFAQSGPSATLSGSSVNVAVSAGPADEDVPSALSDGAGGMFVVWQDLRDSVFTLTDVYAQHYLACGRVDPSWPVNGVALTRGTSDDKYPVIASDGAGGAFVVWNTFAGASVNSDIYAQHLMPYGAIDPGWPANGLAVCTATDRQRVPKITFDGTLGAFVTWDDNRAGRRLFVHHLLASGLDPAWTIDGIPACPTIPTNQAIPVICSDASGGAIVAWVDSRDVATASVDIYAQRMSASGALLWAPGGVPVCTALGQQILNGADFGLIWVLQSSDGQSNAIVPDGAGGCLLTWVDRRGLSDDIYSQRITATGSVAAGWPANGVLMCTDPANQDGASLVPDGSGGAIGTWREASRPAPYAQHVSGAGMVTGPVDGLALSGAGPAWFVPQGVSDGAGGAIFLWEDQRNGAFNDWDIYANHVQTTPAFALDPAWSTSGVPVCTARFWQHQGSGGTVSDGAGGAIAAWADSRNYFASHIDIFAQGLLASGALVGDPVATMTGPASGSSHQVNTPVTFTGSFTDTDTDPHTAKWQFGALPPVSGTVNNAAHTVSVSYTFADTGVYSVQLTVIDQCGGTGTATQVDGVDATVVIVPRPLAVGDDPVSGFALTDVSPNPAVRHTNIDFALPRATTVRLSVADLQGRTVAVLVNGILPAGHHTASWNVEGARGGVTPGVYFAQLEAGSFRATRRFAVTH